jgi:hypothetical protein
VAPFTISGGVIAGVEQLIRPYEVNVVDGTERSITRDYREE